MGVMTEHNMAAAAPPSPRPKGHMWRVSGLIWALVNLAGAAVGLFPAALTPAAQPAGAALPALGVLAVGQVAFLLGAYPLILARRHSCGQRISLGGLAAEAALWLVVGAPFVAACGYFSDAAVLDAVRVELVTAAVFPAAWALAALAQRGLSAATLAAALVVLGAPAALYLGQEFWPGGAPAWLWHVSPVLLAWTAGQARQPSIFPLPLWAWLWPAAAGVVVLVLCRFAARGRRT
jgi:hypothetical protein